MKDHSNPTYLFHWMSQLHDSVFLMKVDDKGFSYRKVTEEAKKTASLPEDFKGKYIDELYPGSVATHLAGQYERALRAGEVTFFSDKMNVVNNAGRYASTILLPVHEEGEVTHIIGITSDLKKGFAAELLETIGMYDYLTGLPNLLKAKQEAGRFFLEEDASKVKAIYFDIDRFKLVNATIGIERSNELLKEIVENVGEVLPDDGLFGRMDGDAFIFVQKMSISEAVLLSEKIIGTIAEIYYYAGDEKIYLSSCVGISGDAGNVDDMISQASIAMRQAKRDGKNNTSIFKETNYVSQKLNETLLEKELEYAIEKGELDVFYQPKLNPRNKEVSYEALARWFSSKYGTVSPAVFIPLAEKSRLIERVTMYVFEKVCQDIHQYEEEFQGKKVAVNLSANVFHRTIIEETLLSAIDKYDIAPGTFELEITESALMEDPEQAEEIINHLRNQGFKVVIDDFGVSYSSLNYLKQFSIDGIKVDQSFVRELQTHELGKDYEIVKMIVTLARKLNLSITAEGVETAAHYDALNQLKVDELQGFYISRPSPVSSLRGMLPTLVAMFEQQWECFAQAPNIEDAEMRRLGELHRLNLESIDFSERYDRITRIVSRTFSAPTAIISLLTKDKQVYKSFVGLPEFLAVAGEVEREYSTCSRMIETRTPLVIPDLTEDGSGKFKQAVEDFGYRFYAGVPLVTRRGEIIGSLCILDKKPRSFDGGDIHLMEEYAGLVMTEIELQEQVNETNHRHRVIKDIYTVILANQSIKISLKKILHIFLDWSRYSGAFLYTEDEECHVTRRADKKIHEETLKEVARKNIGDTYSVYEQHKSPLAASIQVPVLTRGGERRIGSIFLYAFHDDHAAVKDPAVIQDIAYQLSMTAGWAVNEWDREKKQEEISRLVYEDTLTGLSNRKALQERVDILLQKQEEFTVLFLDIDDFKMINDTWGHMVGDEVLKGIAVRLKEMGSSFGAKAYRFAGDEFLVLVQNYGVDRYAEELLQAMRYPISTGEGEVSVSVSIGYYSTKQGKAESFDEIIKKADEAMFLKKSMGGNGVERYM
ncbi:EAL domain-containing protein [Salimicrobium halophilum]|uniref:Diguanylate cyclase (GGDEF) domain-containing protein n=1 Tax=Salimicrobium halophilum TaxID=86666 RepID=A0A1G8WQB7_9BACI|nr:EAL domain-containing protein [Salimicrobium halophilum]SDJ80578.1 diguanylate cyclase (GGDEF) domain-containing protein [Salimicrobium halophilum]